MIFQRYPWLQDVHAKINLSDKLFRAPIDSCERVMDEMKKKRKENRHKTFYKREFQELPHQYVQAPFLYSRIIRSGVFLSSLLLFNLSGPIILKFWFGIFL